MWVRGKRVLPSRGEGLDALRGKTGRGAILGYEKAKSSFYSNVFSAISFRKAVLKFSCTGIRRARGGGGGLLCETVDLTYERGAS